MSGHVKETELALYHCGDLSLWRHIGVRLHLRHCEECRKGGEAFRQDREALREASAQMPAGVNWDRLSAEMAANIRVGLAAGECVAPRGRKRMAWAWQAAAAAASVTLLIGAALWLNFPASDKEVLANALRQLVGGRAHPAFEEAGPVVEASSAGIEWRENGSALKISQGTLRPVAVSVDAQGSASARYVDTDTGQVTITSVYVQ